MNLDNCDGKQARKLGLSTPLGMIIDHGCDSFMTTIATILASILFDWDLKTLIIT